MLSTLLSKSILLNFIASSVPYESSPESGAFEKFPRVRLILQTRAMKPITIPRDRFHILQGLSPKK